MRRKGKDEVNAFPRSAAEKALCVWNRESDS